MALRGPEIIALIILLIILLRPKIITDAARGIGKMVREFKTGAEEDKREKLEKIARQLGIDPSGKSDEELLEEIKKRLSA